MKRRKLNKVIPKEKINRDSPSGGYVPKLGGKDVDFRNKNKEINKLQLRNNIQTKFQNPESLMGSYEKPSQVPNMREENKASNSTRKHEKIRIIL